MNISIIIFFMLFLSVGITQQYNQCYQSVKSYHIKKSIAKIENLEIDKLISLTTEKDTIFISDDIESEKIKLTQLTEM